MSAVFPLRRNLRSGLSERGHFALGGEIPKDLKKHLDEAVKKGETFISVSFNDDGEWFINANKRILLSQKEFKRVEEFKRVGTHI